MKITFDQNVYNQIIKNKILNDISRLHYNPEKIKSYEFEVRFGELSKSGSKSRFKSLIKPEIATKLRQHFINKGLKYEYSKSKVEIFKDKLRKITTFDKEGGKTVRFEKKESLLVRYPEEKDWKEEEKEKDITTYEYKDFAIRFSYAKEDKIEIKDESVLGDILETRNRERHEYKTINYTYSITHVSDHIEFEIEYNLSTSLLQYHSPLQNYVEESINFVLPYMASDQEIVTYMPLGKQNYIRKQYLKKIVKTSKPVNIERQNIIKIKSEAYTVTNKLDGERFYIVFNSYGIYAINYNVVDEILHFNYRDSRYEKEFIIDCERYKKQFYVFDCMYYDGVQIVDLPHQQRLEKAKKLIQPYATMIKMKIFQPVDQTETLLKQLKERVDEENDGLIFTPDNDEYNSKFIFKWKFPEKMSIDFRVKYNTTLETGKYLYYLLSYDSTQQPISFNGTDSFPLADANYISDEKIEDDKIYEFTYNNEDEKFVLLRLRPDKIQPNYITVAQNVWNDIKNPFPEEELIKLLYHTSDEDLNKMKIVNPLEEYRKHHNMAKRELISKYCTDRKNILDLGIGRGGDLSKYSDASIGHLWGIEPDQSNLEECKKRLSQTYKDMLEKTTIISGKAQDTDRIKTFIAFPPTYVSIYDRTYNSNDKSTWFPYSKNVDYGKIMFTEEGQYSVTKRPISKAFIKIMKDMFNDLSLLSIMDATSNIGGDTIQFGLHFKNVVGVEINPENFNVLRNNVNVYGLKNVELFQDSSFRLWNSDELKHTNILFIDPPWGGPEYDKQTSIDIFLYEGDEKIPLDVVLSTLREMPSHGIFLKLPYNYKVEKLLSIKGVKNIHFYTIGKILFAYLDTRKTTPYLIDKSLKTKKIDIISSFFSLSFFFFQRDDLEKLVYTISSTLKPGGWFMGTTIDGERTKKLLDLSNGEFIFNGGYVRWGEKNTVNIFMKDSIMGDQVESLVDFNKLCTELYKHNIILKETRFIEENPLLTPTTQKLNSLYRMFAFQRMSIKDIYLDYTERLIRFVMNKQECVPLFLKLCLLPNNTNGNFKFKIRFPGNVMNEFDGIIIESDKYKQFRMIMSIVPSIFIYKQYHLQTSSTTCFVIKPPVKYFKVIDVIKQLKSSDELKLLTNQCLMIVEKLKMNGIFVDYKEFECMINEEISTQSTIIEIGKFIVKIPETITFLSKNYKNDIGLNPLLQDIIPVVPTLIKKLGLPNLGNTCYFNSSIQSLASLEPFVTFFKDVKKGNVSIAFSQLIDMVNSRSEIKEIYPIALRKEIGRFNPQFGHRNFKQQDADEFINLLFEILHREINTKDGIDSRYVYDSSITMENNIKRALELYFEHNDSIISRLFTILQKVTLQCKVCKKERIYLEPTYTCNVVLPSSSLEVDLQTLLDNCTVRETLTDPVYCESCGKNIKTEHDKITENVYFSPIVKITLLRFKGYGSHRVKNDVMVDFPFTIQLKDKNYDLQSVINHMGETGGGHYTSYRKIDEKWYEFNDRHVIEIKDADDVRSRSGYVMFYVENVGK